jgi:hypothetical protein
MIVEQGDRKPYFCQFLWEFMDDLIDVDEFLGNCACAHGFDAFLFVWICFGIGGFKAIKKSTSNMFKNWGI